LYLIIQMRVERAVAVKVFRYKPSNPEGEIDINEQSIDKQIKFLFTPNRSSPFGG
jgi:hypothetical protein